MPCELLTQNLTVNCLLVLSDAFSFTGVSKSGKTLSCRRSYKDFQNKFNMSRSTVWRSVSSAKKRKLIERKNGIYSFDLSRVKNGRDCDFLQVPDWIHAKTFTIDGKERTLKDTELLVYSFFYTRCNNRNNSTRYYTGSSNGIANKIGKSERTVYRAINCLMHAKLIYRTHKGVNGYNKSEYTINFKFVRDTEKSFDKKFAESQKSDSSYITDRRDYYVELRHRAEDIAHSNLERARKYMPFREAEKKLSELAIKSAFPGTDAKDVEREFKKARQFRAAVMRELGFSDDDFKPQYKCKKCNDTGFRISDGHVCDCYPPGRLK